MTKIQQLIKRKERKHFVFKPDIKFYQEVGINQKRWGMIYRGEVDPTISELKSIANYFESDITKLL